MRIFKIILNDENLMGKLVVTGVKGQRLVEAEHKRDLWKIRVMDLRKKMEMMVMFIF